MNRRVILTRYPDGRPAAEDFAVEEVPTAACSDGEILVAVSHLSMDPFPRLRMRADSRVGPPMALGATVGGRGVGRVVASKHADWAVGDWLHAETGWQSLAVLSPAGCERINTKLAPAERYLSVLGPSGLTAYMTTVAVGEVGPGKRFALAPAAGSVGTIAGQIARLKGAHTVGIASAAQVGALAGFGYDVAVDYAAPETAPADIDIFVDGVGGALHDAMLPRLSPRARVVLLGFISGYNDAGPPLYGNAMPILMKRARMEGFLLADWADRFDEARAALAGWLRTGDIVPVETIWAGLDSAPAAFAALFGDAAPGKQIVSIEG